MSKPVTIDFVAPPFAGHLFPQLELARGLAERGVGPVRFFSTPEAKSAILASGFDLFPLIKDRSHIVFEIANTHSPIGSNPFKLLSQFKLNLSLMSQLRDELSTYWHDSRPDLVVADFTVPVAGVLAKQLGIPWWTSLPTPSVVDTVDGTPAYLGGWLPPRTSLGRLRDFAGRQIIRTFKRTLFQIYRTPLRRLGVDRVYRDDGFEAIYSDERILALGVREFEFPRQWPSSLQFIGPLTASPSTDHQAPVFIEGKRHLLVSLGTHLLWAKENARTLMKEVAAEGDDWVIHFTDGRFGAETNLQQVRFHNYGYLPYDRYLDRYDAVLHHGGTGITYASLRHGVPALVWPQDYDQFDHAARLVYHGLGMRVRPSANLIREDLDHLVSEPHFRENLDTFADIIGRHAPIDQVAELIKQLESAKHPQQALSN
ncbi:glycosyltransferase [Roseiconus lacunae]|uniref:glycosyltransferase n=1 Tax=Roseiconus lacunae TaxID=2605694 RepID=UPI001E55FD1E|nr:nucleotide disphospho-sugar-binding domain-containing protein [Roseiconus lacunae]MCD0461923.1 hypothetical protein [Roseiconus lacunae]